MEPIIRLPANRIRAVFSDLDDTLTNESQILPETFASLAKLKERNFFVAIVSGRPAGWADCLMRLWPIDAIVFENGAGVMTRDREKILTTNLSAQKSSNRLKEIFDTLKRDVPSLKLATDQPFRLFDYAIDYSEEPPFLSAGDLETVWTRLQQFDDITAKLSSIHINYWLGHHTKVTACEYLLTLPSVCDRAKHAETLYCGDSPNDEPLFQFFEHSVGVSNIQRFVSKMKVLPKYVTTRPGGLGFQEIAQLLLTQLA